LSVQRIGRYEIIRELGRGSMGVVYEATDTRNGLKVALKLLTLSQAITGVDRRQAVERFQREANAAGSLVHPNIAQVYETGEFNGNNYMVMEYCKGTTLRNMLKYEKRIPEENLKTIMDQLLSALEVAHAANIIHRDIKPDNIIVGADNRIKLMDFGIAKLVDAGTMTQAGQMMGSPAYMSPEQIMGRPIDARTDLFSTGVTIYECLSGKKPFNADTVTGITHQIMYTEPEPLLGVSTYWAGIIWKAMHKEPANRYLNATQMRADIKNQRAPVIPQPQPAIIQNQTTFAPSPAPVIQPQQYPQQSPSGQVSTPAYGQQYSGYQQPMGVPGYGQPNVNSNPQQYGPPYSQNTSGMGSMAVVPYELRSGWNWGAFFLTFFWSISNQVWIGLLCLVPYLGWVMCIIMGIKGNEWAWMYRRWDSIQHFRDTQRVWANWSLWVFVASIILGFLLGFLGALANLNS